MPRQPGGSSCCIVWIVRFFAQIGNRSVLNKRNWMRLLSPLKPWEAASVRTYRFGGKNDGRTLLNPQEIVANGHAA